MFEEWRRDFFFSLSPAKLRRKQWARKWVSRHWRRCKIEMSMFQGSRRARSDGAINSSAREEWRGNSQCPQVFFCKQKSMQITAWKCAGMIACHDLLAVRFYWRIFSSDEKAEPGWVHLFSFHEKIIGKHWPRQIHFCPAPTGERKRFFLST